MQGCGMELHKLQVGELSTDMQSHRQALPLRACWIGRVGEELPDSARRQHTDWGTKNTASAHRVKAAHRHHMPLLVLQQSLCCDAFMHLDTWCLTHRTGHRAHDLKTGPITLGMHDARVTVGRLAREVQLPMLSVESAAQIDQPLDRFWRCSAHLTNDRSIANPDYRSIANPDSGIKRIANVELDRITRTQRRRDAALCPVTRAIDRKASRTQQQHSTRCGRQGHTQSCDT